MFKEINDNNIENLIIDIRGNPGASNSLATLLNSYIYDEPFSQVSRTDMKVSEYENEDVGKQDCEINIIKIVRYFL